MHLFSMEVRTIENTKVKNFFDKKSKGAQDIIVKIIEDSLLCLYNQEKIQEDTLNRIISFYFLLIEHQYDKMIEFDDFTADEKKIIFQILIEGIASVYVDNEYLEYSDRGTKYKQVIIEELLSFFRYITKFSKEKVFKIYYDEVQRYRRLSFSWDDIPY